MSEIMAEFLFEITSDEYREKYCEKYCDFMILHRTNKKSSSLNPLALARHADAPCLTGPARSKFCRCCSRATCFTVRLCQPVCLPVFGRATRCLGCYSVNTCTLVLPHTQFWCPGPGPGPVLHQLESRSDLSADSESRRHCRQRLTSSSSVQ